MRDRAQQVGLFRYSLVREAASEELSTRQRGRLVRAIAAREHPGPDGRWVRVSRTSLDRWIRAYRRGGFDALVPEPRRAQRQTPGPPADAAGHAPALNDNDLASPPAPACPKTSDTTGRHRPHPTRRPSEPPRHTADRLRTSFPTDRPVREARPVAYCTQRRSRPLLHDRGWYGRYHSSMQLRWSERTPRCAASVAARASCGSSRAR